MPIDTIGFGAVVASFASFVAAVGQALARRRWRERDEQRAHERRRANLDALSAMVRRHGVPEVPAVTWDFELPETRWCDRNGAVAGAGTYRTSLVRVPRLDTAPRTGLRAVAYLGNELALRARPASAWRLLAAWLRGAMVRLWWCGRTEWTELFFITDAGGPSSEYRRVVKGTSAPLPPDPRLEYFRS